MKKVTINGFCHFYYQSWNYSSHNALGDINRMYNVAMGTIRLGVFRLYLLTFWSTGTIEIVPNQLLAVLVSNLTMDIKTTIITLKKNLKTCYKERLYSMIYSTRLYIRDNDILINANCSSVLKYLSPHAVPLPLHPHPFNSTHPTV